MQEIELRITPEGKVLISTTGFEGDACLQITKALEEALGDVEERTYTSEYYRQSGLESRPAVGVTGGREG